MHFVEKKPSQKRIDFDKKLKSNKILRVPGAYNPLTAKLIEQLDKADAHPYGSRPFIRSNYINKFLVLTKNIISKKESNRFLKTVQNLKKLKSGQIQRINVEVKKSKLKSNLKIGIF